MNCPYCKKEIGNAEICPNCWASVKTEEKADKPIKPNKAKPIEVIEEKEGVDFEA